MSNANWEILNKARGPVTVVRKVHGRDFGLTGQLKASRLKGKLMGWRLMRGDTRLAWLSVWDCLDAREADGTPANERRDHKAPLTVAVLRGEGG